MKEAIEMVFNNFEGMWNIKLKKRERVLKYLEDTLKDKLEEKESIKPKKNYDICRC